MKMTSHQVFLVKQTWDFFRNIGPAVVGDIFYTKLFFDNPSLEKMFPKNMDAQYQKLVDMISVIVGRLDSFETLSEDIKAMGVRHKQYGAKPEHYKMIGDTLLWTLQQGMGNDWDDETEKAWRLCYNLIADTMLEAAVEA